MERATKKADKKEVVKKIEKVEKVKVPVSPIIDEEKLEKAVEKETKKEEVVFKPPVSIVEIAAEVTEEREIMLKNTGGSFHMGRRRIIKPGKNLKLNGQKFLPVLETQSIHLRIFL